MNPKFTESKFTAVTLNSFIFVMDIFCSNPARKFVIIDIAHEVSRLICNALGESFSL